MLPASLCAKIMVFRRITRIIEVVLNERAVIELYLTENIFEVQLYFIYLYIIKLQFYTDYEKTFIAFWANIVRIVPF